MYTVRICTEVLPASKYDENNDVIQPKCLKQNTLHDHHNHHPARICWGLKTEGRSSTRRYQKRKSRTKGDRGYISGWGVQSLRHSTHRRPGGVGAAGSRRQVGGQRSAKWCHQARAQPPAEGGAGLL